MKIGTRIDCSFPPNNEAQQLYRRVVKTKPKAVKLAEHARGLLRKGLDCTCATAKAKAPKVVSRPGKRCAGDGQ